MIYDFILLSSLFSTKSSQALWFLPATSCIFFFFTYRKAFGLNEDLTSPFPHVTTHSYANVGVGGKGSAAFGKVPELNAPYNTINMELMTALRHAFSKLILKVGVECVTTLLGNEISLKNDGR